MEVRIGIRAVAALKPQEKPYQLHDTEIHGFLIRVQPSGVMTYYYEYRLPNGLRNRIRIEKHGKVTPEQARDRVKLIAAELVRGVDPKASKKQAKVPNLRQYVENIYRRSGYGAAVWKSLLLRFAWCIFQGHRVE